MASKKEDHRFARLEQQQELMGKLLDVRTSVSGGIETSRWGNIVFGQSYSLICVRHVLSSLVILQNMSQVMSVISHVMFVMSHVMSCVSCHMTCHVTSYV